MKKDEFDGVFEVTIRNREKQEYGKEFKEYFIAYKSDDGQLIQLLDYDGTADFFRPEDLTPVIDVADEPWDFDSYDRSGLDLSQEEHESAFERYGYSDWDIASEELMEMSIDERGM